MSENVFFCFSGTGNCLDMAKNIARGLGDTDIVMMRSVPTVTDVRGAKRVGFIFPCYAGGLPGGVEETLNALQVDPVSYKFAVCQCAAYPGTGLSIVDRLFHLDYWQVVTHQCSCIWLFPHTMMMPPLSPEAAQERSEREAKRIAQEVSACKRSDKAPKANPLNKAESSAWPMLSKKKAKKFTVSSMCIGCGTCVKVCPKRNIRMLDGRPQFGTDCLQCLACLQYCPQEAISLGRITQKREHYHNPNVTADDLIKPVIHIE
jgi:ferredoxin